MAFERYISQEWKSTPSSVMTETGNYNGCFDCNICLDFALEPVVTLCGHLYCWPCIFKWLHVQSSSLASHEHPQCPVCRADISLATMVPLYGRGQTPAPSEQDTKASCHDTCIPPRPRAFSAQSLMSASSSQGGHHQYLPFHCPRYSPQHFSSPPYQRDEDSSSQVLNLSTTLTPQGFHHHVAGMVYARVFGNPENLYAYRNSYQQMGSNSPRLRRQEMQADKSLNRISFFLFCCFVLCLIVF
ncbi:E3 ubiquitin-protein ligase RMA1H1-like [Prosopis cineraria]|uniref:E3 ubiquitin-protein ligase RMA1H1-like n=1 Tax=Prosopis cineraria TaxID=364024 RepID=UPI00240FD056|nr:E3 ubiquitin-protein ligase RMA1H1-like [Prosopis cineraria]